MKRGERILLLLGFGELGGAERQAIYLAEGLKEKGHKVFVLNFGPKGLSNKILDQKGIRNFNTALRLKPTRKDILWDLLKLYFRIVPIRPAVIIPFTKYPNIYSTTLRTLLPLTKVIWNQRDDGKGLQSGKIEKYAINKAYRIVSNSTPGKHFLIKNFQLNPASVQIINNAVEVNSRSNNFPDGLNVGMIANLHPKKDHDTLIRAWKKLKERNPGNQGQLLIAGRDDGSLNRLIRLAEQLRVRDSIKFVGQVEDIHQFIQQLHIGVHSSLHEGCPNAILEMMSHKLPVIANDIPGNIDALGVNYPLYFRTGDSDDLGDKLSRLASDRTFCVSIGRQNYARVVAHFSCDQMVNKYSELLNLH